MKIGQRFKGTIEYVTAHWPTYLVLYGGAVLVLILLGISIQQGWLSYIPMATAVLIILVYFFVTSIWSAHQLYDQGGVNPHHELFEMGQIKATDTFVYIDLGERKRAIALSRRLTTGRIIIIDVYNPQWVLNNALIRWRKQWPSMPPDPRISWQEGNIKLLPLPDESVSRVILCQIASEFWQRGDQHLLLQEIYRILTPNGRLLMAERVRNQTNWLMMGLSVLTLDPIDKWHTLLQKSGFVIRSEKGLSQLIHCIRADKPTPAEANQLALQLPFE